MSTENQLEKKGGQFHATSACASMHYCIHPTFKYISKGEAAWIVKLQ